jgi:flavin-dependent dehydrogenase
VAVAIRGYVPVAARPDELVIEFARGRYPAYAWAFPVAGGGANVGYGVFDRRGGGSRRELLAALAALLPGEEPDPTTVRGHHLPLSTGPRHHPDGRVLLVGDAAALVNPLTGEGIYDAVASGALAGHAALTGLDGGDAGRTHRAAMRRAFGRHRSHLAVLARLVPHARFLDAAVAAAARDPAVFDAAVDLGLAGGTADWHAVRAITRELVLGHDT